MFSPPPTAGDTDTSIGLPIRRIYDPNAGRLTVVVDTYPSSEDDVRVYAGPAQIRVRVTHEDGKLEERTFTPPSPRDAFTEDRHAVYNNGVLEIRLGVARRNGRVAGRTDAVT